ncbi:hypothetical protein [Pseudomonas sp. PLMAX]|uniref:hypothetical protein n=1 Tax=Pseudomonas sp. PLMAX TaxID=2201998 RepID=UPI0038B934ED
MDNTKKKSRYAIIATCIFNLAFLAGAIVLTHYLVFKPLFEAIDYKLTNTIEVIDVYKQASKGDQKALDRLEQLSHKDVSTAYVMLNILYREDALKKAGVDMTNPKATFEAVDLSKSNTVILRAVEEARDLELLSVLRNSEELFNDTERDRIFSGLDDAEVSTTLKNRAKFSVYSTFDQQTKDQLTACKLKLDEKFKHQWAFFTNFHSFGACTKTPPDGSFKRIWEIQHGQFGTDKHEEKAE